MFSLRCRGYVGVGLRTGWRGLDEEGGRRGRVDSKD